MSSEEKPQHAIDYLIFLEKKGKRPSTLRRYRYDLEDFLAWIRVHEFTYEDKTIYTEAFIQSYFDYLVEERAYSFRTLKRVYSVLKQYHTFLTSKKIISENPLSSIILDQFEDDRLKADMFISENEIEQLIRTLPSEDGLTENQLKAHPYLAPRNLAIVRLMTRYGLSLQHIVSLDMRDVSFINKQMVVRGVDGVALRNIMLDEDTGTDLYEYYKLIPTAVRPEQYRTDPLFVAFDFQRLTYRWNYEDDRPKRLTEIAIQKMIRQEIQRSGLRKGISSQHFRRTAILNAIRSENDPDVIQERFGLKTPLTLNRYYRYLEHEASAQKG